MRNRSIAGSVWTVRAGSRHSRMQPASVSARRSRRSAPRSSTSPPSDEIEPPAKSAVTFLRLTAGRSNGRRVSSVMAAWRFRCFGGISLGNEFLPETNGLRHVRHLVLRPWRIHQVRYLPQFLCEAWKAVTNFAANWIDAVEQAVEPPGCETRRHGDEDVEESVRHSRESRGRCSGSLPGGRSGPRIKSGVTAGQALRHKRDQYRWTAGLTGDAGPREIAAPPRGVETP